MNITKFSESLRKFYVFSAIRRPLIQLLLLIIVLIAFFGIGSTATVGVYEARQATLQAGRDGYVIRINGEGFAGLKSGFSAKWYQNKSGKHYDCIIETDDNNNYVLKAGREDVMECFKEPIVGNHSVTVEARIADIQILRRIKGIVTDTLKGEQADI